MNQEFSFLTSATSIANSPPQDRSELAFLGRSNVGKSSLINAFCNQKNLAKSSSTPGKTRLINFFDSKKLSLRLVDLPGIGFAKVSKQEQKQWQENLSHFLQARSSIRIFLHLIDSRHTNLEIDKNLANFLSQILRPDQKIINIFTKTDKLKKQELSLLEKLPNSICVSNQTKQGVEKLKAEVFGFLENK